MTLKEFIILIPDEYMEYIEGVSYAEGDDGFVVALAFTDNEYTFTANLNLFSDGTSGVYEYSAFNNEDQERDMDYISTKFIRMINGLDNVWKYHVAY